MPTPKSHTMLPAKLEQERVVHWYRLIAPLHDAFAALVESRAHRAALNSARVRDGESILEVAVGTGLSFVHLVKQNPYGRTVGIDKTPAMLRRAKKRIARTVATDQDCQLIVGDAFALPFPSASFDLLFSSYMLDMMKASDMVPLLAEFRRVLRPNGRAVLLSMSPPERTSEAIWETLYRIHPFFLGGCRGVSLSGPAREAGFSIDDQYRVVQFGFPSEVLCLSN